MRALIAVLLLTVAAQAAPDCYCTDTRGERREVGETACLTVDGRRVSARCEMFQNVPGWRPREGGCVGA